MTNRLKTYFTRWTGATHWVTDARSNYRPKLVLDVEFVHGFGDPVVKDRPIELRLSKGQAAQLVDELTARLEDWVVE